MDQDASALQLDSAPLLLGGQEYCPLGPLGGGRGVVVYRVKGLTGSEDLVRGHGQGAGGALCSARALLLLALAAARLPLPASIGNHPQPLSPSYQPFSDQRPL